MADQNVPDTGRNQSDTRQSDMGQNDRNTQNDRNMSGTGQVSDVGSKGGETRGVRTGSNTDTDEATGSDTRGANRTNDSTTDTDNTRSVQSS